MNSPLDSLRSTTEATLRLPPSCPGAEEACAARRPGVLVFAVCFPRPQGPDGSCEDDPMDGGGLGNLPST